MIRDHDSERPRSEACAGDALEQLRQIEHDDEHPVVVQRPIGVERSWRRFEAGPPADETRNEPRHHPRAGVYQPGKRVLQAENQRVWGLA